jgi:putative transposase
MQKQLMIEFPLPRIHGGARKGSGRKRQGKRAKVCHSARQPFGKTRVLHVTCRVAEGLPRLRDHKTARLVMDYLAGHCEKMGFRVVEYSIQGNHVHLVCEATDNEALSKAMNGLLSGLARVLNRHWGRRGKVFEDRYHVEILETPRQCRNALLYVLHNAKKHGSRAPRSGADPYSTAPWFPFTSCASHRTDAKPAAHPRTWLLKEGWRKGGPIHLHDHPRLPTKPTRLPAA